VPLASLVAAPFDAANEVAAPTVSPSGLCRSSA